MGGGPLTSTSAPLCTEVWRCWVPSLSLGSPFHCFLYRTSLSLKAQSRGVKTLSSFLGLTLGSRGELLITQTPKLRNISTLRQSTDSPGWYFRRFAKLFLEETPFSDIQGVFFRPPIWEIAHTDKNTPRVPTAVFHSSTKIPDKEGRGLPLTNSSGLVKGLLSA